MSKGTDISSSQGGSSELPAVAFDSLPGFWALLGRGLTRRCAWCGDRKAYFTGWFRRQDACGACRHGWRRGDEAFELGATTANIILTFFNSDRDSGGGCHHLAGCSNCGTNRHHWFSRSARACAVVPGLIHVVAGGRSVHASPRTQ